MRVLLVLIAISVSSQLVAQRKAGEMQFVKAPGTICYAGKKNAHTNIDAPRKSRGGGRVQSANIEVTYLGFSLTQQEAFQEAVDIWASLLESDVTIRIHARMTGLDAGVLGAAGPDSYVHDFEGAPKKDVWYPIALAEKIARTNLNGGDYDIVSTFNSNAPWHFAVGSNPPADKFDFISVVLHEIGHGLGITHGYAVHEDLAFIPSQLDDMPVVYETNVFLPTLNMVSDFTQPSANLKNALTGGTARFSSPLVNSANGGSPASIYAPAEYSAGSSIAHLDEDSYPAGTPNSLMTPFLDAAERALDPGPVSAAILYDIGWTVTTLEHTPIEGTEATGPYHAVVKIHNTNGYSASSVNLTYLTDTGFDTEIDMTATGNPDEYQANMPGGKPYYNYFISVVDAAGRTFSTPGISVQPGTAPQQLRHFFAAGPDVQKPNITHDQGSVEAIFAHFKMQAEVYDNLGIDNVKVEMRINNVAQPDKVMTLVPGTETTYELVLNFTEPLPDGYLIEYRIRAEDKSVAGNVEFAPSASTFYEATIEGLEEARDSYFNNFDDLSGDDFFGNGFTVSKPAGFGNGAIHSDHPYAIGGIEPGKAELIYYLKTPIRMASSRVFARLKFDQIVLVEPGEVGAAWPDPDFYDYVIVEGSTDGGGTWTPVMPGFDSRTDFVWLNEWDNGRTDDGSSATGFPGLYRTYEYILLDGFTAGSEVIFRFRLYSDEFTNGWGWAIDNLKIQIDDTPPAIKHQHTDYMLAGQSSITLDATASDAKNVEEFFFDFNINDGEVNTINVLSEPGENVPIQLTLSDLNLDDGDELQYRFRAIDATGNVGLYPSTDFIKVPVISFSSSIDQLVTDFATEHTNLSGNFFKIENPGFTSSGWSTNHPYDNDLEISWLTKKPIKVSSDNAIISFEEIALVEYQVFNNSPVGKDYVVVEASKDGINWTSLVDPYAAIETSIWKAFFDQHAFPTEGLYRVHVIDITKNNKFKAGDLILIRFRLFADEEFNGWGWIVDNLSIQGPSTVGIEPETSAANFNAWPNPVTDGFVNVKLELPGASQVNVEFLTTQGQLLHSEQFSAPSGEFLRHYDVNDWPNGFYLLRVSSDFGTSVHKLIKSR